MQIRINEVSLENKGKYNALKVSYNSDGKDSEKNLVSFKNEDVFEVMQEAKTDEIYEVKSVKEGKYWQWVAASKVDNTPKGSKVGGNKNTNTYVNTYETPEERAKKQVYIVRQSSIGHAISFVSKDATIDDVLTVAKEFERYIFDTQENKISDYESEVI